MLTVALNADCDLFTLTTPTLDYITSLDNPVPTDCCAALVLSKNCCTTSEKTLYLRHLYPFVVTVENCEAVNIDGIDYHKITFGVSGVEASCVSSWTFEDSPITTASVTDPGVLEFDYLYTAAQSGGTHIIEVGIHTCSGNLSYALTFNFTPNGFADPCDYALLQPAIAYPSLPTGVTINGASLEIDPTVYDVTSSIFGDGVFYFSLSKNGIPVIDSMFTDCEVKCRVISFLSDYPCSDVYLFYEALTQSNDCDTVTYSQQCDLWKYLGKKLNYFSTDPCADASPCGCQDQGTIILN